MAGSRVLAVLLLSVTATMARRLPPLTRRLALHHGAAGVQGARQMEDASGTNLMEVSKEEKRHAEGDAVDCSQLYREAQTGSLCGRHAINSVLCNLHVLGKGRAPEGSPPKCTVARTDQYLKNYSSGAGLQKAEPFAQGFDGYDIGLLFAVLQQDLQAQMGADFYDEVLAVNPNDGLHPVSYYVGERAFEISGFHFTRELNLENLDWLICNAGPGHWKTYFHLKKPWGNFCDLDSVHYHVNPPNQVTAEQLLQQQCAGVINPAQWGEKPKRPPPPPKPEARLTVQELEELLREKWPDDTDRAARVPPPKTKTNGSTPPQGLSTSNDQHRPLGTLEVFIIAGIGSVAVLLVVVAAAACLRT